MTNLKTKKKLAARVFGVGKNRLKLNTEQVEKLDDAITRGSIRSLKKDNVVTLPKKQGVSRGRHSRQNRKLKRGRTQGSKEGAKQFIYRNKLEEYEYKIILNTIDDYDFFRAAIGPIKTIRESIGILKRIRETLPKAAFIKLVKSQ